MVPRCDPLAPITNDMPQMRIVWATPLVERMISSAWAIAASVRSIEAESGSWTTAYRYPWSWSGMKPVGIRPKLHWVRQRSPP